MCPRCMLCSIQESRSATDICNDQLQMRVNWGWAMQMIHASCLWGPGQNDFAACPNKSLILLSWKRCCRQPSALQLSQLQVNWKFLKHLSC